MRAQVAELTRDEFRPFARWVGDAIDARAVEPDLPPYHRALSTYSTLMLGPARITPQESVGLSARTYRRSAPAEAVPWREDSGALVIVVESIAADRLETLPRSRAEAEARLGEQRREQIKAADRANPNLSRIGGGGPYSR